MKRHLILCLLILLSNKLLAQNDSIPKKEIVARQKSETISIINLIANPEKYDGKRISISGYMVVEFEGTAIYLSRDDFDNRIYKNGIFLSLNTDLNNFRIYHKEFVTLDGTFSIRKGHMSLFSGELLNVNYIRKKR
ncbi:hypothetical protein LZZ90_10855 [Flavobacterium sp. SM15]|uniref:hypothetical protein n=1 Tax=Flavobacterium sp. SM15 TaxID=2908005 RepID=UPI001ED9D215|nr:hypothetical protein [Flavobacterium sp. SM15]MCG2612006.1 hypothetical protein [Flavobacterium sp. SM15]